MELTLEELIEIKDSLDHSTQEIDTDLYDRLCDRIIELEELNDMDFDDCAGGACRL